MRQYIGCCLRFITGSTRMSQNKILSALVRRFSAPKAQDNRRIIFWYDSDGGFQTEAESIVPEGVKFLRLGRNTFAIKKTLEHDDVTSDYLVYAPFARPEDRDNYLLDVELYSESFSADRASLVMDDIGVADFDLKPVFNEHIAFFGSKQRTQAFKTLGDDLKSAGDIERAMVAVLAGTRTTDAEEIVRAVLLQSLDDEENKAFAEMVKMNVDGAFWALCKGFCGFNSENPTLRKLFHSLLLTATAEQLRLDGTTGWGTYILPKQHRSRVVVFIDHWITHTLYGGQFETYANEAWHQLDLERKAEKWPLEALVGGRTFEEFDRMALAEIARGLAAGEDAFDRWDAWIGERRRSYWWPRYEQAYGALTAAISLLRLKSEYEGRFQETSARLMVAVYVKEYSRFDRLYRDFHTARSQVASDFLHQVSERVEDLYTNWFLRKLMDRWTTIVETELAGRWRIDDVPSQRQFFEDMVLRTAGDRNKVFVLISDGLRYEVAAELAEKLEKETFSKPELGYMLGSLPSYTKLGMASLLPNRSITWGDSDEILVDGCSTVSSGDRQKILQSAFPDSTVVNYRDLKTWSRDEARQNLNGARVIYIYHNEIDMVGDKVATEQKTFEAAARTVEELKEAVLKIGNSLNGTYVYVTADHGFLFQQEPLPDSEKVAVDSLDKVAASRRYVVAGKGQNIEGAIEVSMDWLLGAGAARSVYVPKGNVRFNAPGGARYVHGGASLQEVVIPALFYTHTRKSYARAEEASRVDVVLTNSDNRITTAQFALNFFQSVPVGGKVLPRHLRVALWATDGEEKKISTEELLVADSASERTEDRTYRVTLHLNPDVPNGDYALRLVDAENQMEYRTINFRVSLAIMKPAFWS